MFIIINVHCVTVHVRIHTNVYNVMQCIITYMAFHDVASSRWTAAVLSLLALISRPARIYYYLLGTL